LSCRTWSSSKSMIARCWSRACILIHPAWRHASNRLLRRLPRKN